MHQNDERRQLEHVREELVGEFAGAVAEPAVDATFRRALARFDGATVRTYLPVLVRRVSRTELRRLVSTR
jgi:hypothetical protein